MPYTFICQQACLFVCQFNTGPDQDCSQRTNLNAFGDPLSFPLSHNQAKCCIYINVDTLTHLEGNINTKIVHVTNGKWEAESQTSAERGSIGALFQFIV